MDAKTLNELYERYKIEPDLATKPLYEALLEYAHKIGRVQFESSYDLDEFRDACHDAGTDVFLSISKFSKKSLFSTWVHGAIKNILMNWIRDEKVTNTVTLDDPEHPVVVYDEALPIDTKLYYAQLLGRLSKEDRELFAAIAEGQTQEEIAKEQGVTQQAISLRWARITSLLKAWNDEKPGNYIDDPRK